VRVTCKKPAEKVFKQVGIEEDSKGGKTGFKYDPTMQRWVKTDNNTELLDADDFDPMIRPKWSGDAYTMWPVCHTALKEYGLKSLDPEEVMGLQKRGAVLLDVREERQYNKVHAAGAINVPMFIPVQGNSLFDNTKRLAMAAFAMQATERNPRFLEEVQEKIPTDKQIILICATGGYMYTVVKTTSGNAGKYGGRIKEKTYADPERAFGKESRSLKAAYELITYGGYKKVAHVDGGLNAWRSNDYPLETLE